MSAVDPDVDLHVPAHRRELRPRTLVVIAVGGAVGALARYGVELVLPTVPGRFPWGTFVINVVGCLLIGVLMVLVTDVFTGRPLLRPFVGVGVLGGFTTFSTYANEARGLLRPGSVPVAFGYLAGTLVSALLAVLVGMVVARRLWGLR
jgi:CrcB protein